MGKVRGGRSKWNAKTNPMRRKASKGLQKKSRGGEKLKRVERKKSFEKKKSRKNGLSGQFGRKKEVKKLQGSDRVKY